MEYINSRERRDTMRADWEKEITRLVTQRLASLEVTEAHSAFHLKKVAELTQGIGEIYGLNRREKELAYAAGLFHDIIRSPRQDPARDDDEEASAKKACQILGEAGLITAEEGAVIAYAIEGQGNYPEWWGDSETRERLPETLEEKLHLALFVADKMEQNGVRAIVRRCSFAAGDRLRGEKGDWRAFGFKPDKDEGLVVAIASIYRLTYLNPEEIYPLRLSPIVHPLYEIQREFVSGLFRNLNLRVEDVARLLLERKDNRGRNILQVMVGSKEAQTDLTELVALIISRGQIANERIGAVSDELAASSLETVGYFSRRYQEDLSQLILNWRPQGQKAKEWKRSLEDYEKGFI